jgi:hypothetical protein
MDVKVKPLSTVKPTKDRLFNEHLQISFAKQFYNIEPRALYMTTTTKA